MTLKDREKEIKFSKNFSKQDWLDSWESTERILLLAKPSDREIYENMIVKIFNDTQTSRKQKAQKVSIIIITLANKENFTRLMKQNRKDFVKVFDLVAVSIGPSQFKALLKGAYLKLKKKAGR